MDYAVYGILSVAIAVGVWLLAPERRRLGVINAGRGAFSWLARHYSRKRAALSAAVGRERKERELYEAISFLRNVISVNHGGGIGSDMALERLAERGGILKKSYAKTLSLLRVNKRDEAERCFAAAAGGGLARDFIRVVLQWDQIAPEELAESLVSYQKSLKETRITCRKKRDELISDLVYIPVVVNVMVIFLNFIYVSYFTGQREILANFFGG